MLSGASPKCQHCLLDCFRGGFGSTHACSTALHCGCNSTTQCVKLASRTDGPGNEASAAAGSGTSFSGHSGSVLVILKEGRAAAAAIILHFGGMCETQRPPAGEALRLRWMKMMMMISLCDFLFCSFLISLSLSAAGNYPSPPLAAARAYSPSARGGSGSVPFFLFSSFAASPLPKLSPKGKEKEREMTKAEKELGCPSALPSSQDITKLYTRR